MVDAFLARPYRFQTYNCYDFGRDVWLHWTGEDLGDRKGGMGHLVALHRNSHKRRIEAPTGLCIIAADQGRRLPHMAILRDGMAYHLREIGGRVEPLAEFKQEFPNLRFFE